MRQVPLRFDYLKDPQAIYRKSFTMIDEALADKPQATDLGHVASRIVHACGMPDIIDDLICSDRAAEAGGHALKSGATILCDAQMVAAGIIRSHLPANNCVICTLNDPATPALAKKHETTRSAAALDLWTAHLKGSVVAIGNAPTALFRLLEMISDGAPKPALILGFAVGFVGAAQSKQALIDHADSLGVSFITVKGMRGGSAMASAGVNALAGGNTS